MIRFDQLTHANAETLSNLAKAIYLENYLHLWLPGGADWYMNQYAYPIQQLEQELVDSNIAYYMLRFEQMPDENKN